MSEKGGELVCGWHDSRHPDGKGRRKASGKGPAGPVGVEQEGDQLRIAGLTAHPHPAVGKAYLGRPNTNPCRKAASTTPTIETGHPPERLFWRRRLGAPHDEMLFMS